MQAAPGSIFWVAAQPSVLGRCGGGGGGGGGGGAGVRGVGVVRCSVRAQEKRPPRVRKSKEERREMVESFINSYRIAHDGKFPSVNLTHKEVGGSYYIVREIVRDVIQENRVLGPGGLDSMALSFEDYRDSSEVSMKHELGQDKIEILAMSDDGQAGQDSVSESSSRQESFSLQINSINTEILLGSSNILEAGVLRSVVQNGTASAAAFLETNLEKQDEVPSGGSIEGLLHTEDQHSVVQVDGSNFNKSTSGFTKEEVEATDSSHEQGMSTTTVISRRTLKATLKAQQKKDDNLFWLVLRAFVVAISKIWAK